MLTVEKCIKGIKRHRKMDKQTRLIEALRRMVNDTHMSQHELAERLGVTQPTIGRWLKGGVSRISAHCLTTLEDLVRPYMESAALDPVAITNTSRLREYLTDRIIDTQVTWEQVQLATGVADIDAAKRMVMRGDVDWYPSSLMGMAELIRSSIRDLPISNEEKQLLFRAHAPAQLPNIPVIPCAAKVNPDTWQIEDSGEDYKVERFIQAPDRDATYCAFELTATDGRYRKGDIVVVKDNHHPEGGKRSIIILDTGEIVCAKYMADPDSADAILFDANGSDQDLRTVPKSSVKFVSTVVRLIRVDFD